MSEKAHVPCLSCHTLNQFVLQSGARKECVLHSKKRKEKSAPFGVNLMRSQVLHQAARGIIISESLRVAAEQKAQQACLQGQLGTTAGQYRQTAPTVQAYLL